MTGGQVTTGLQSIFKKTGLREDITCTIVRKSVVSTVHQDHPDMKSRLANHMLHREATASRCYNLIEREKNSVVASQKIREIMNNTQSEAMNHVLPVSSNEGILPSDVDTVNESLSTTSKTIPPISLSVGRVPYLMMRKRPF